MLDPALPVGDALANVAPVFEHLGHDDKWLADYLHQLLMKVVSARVPDSALSSEAVRRIKSAFARAMLRGVIRILDSWEAASPRHEESCAEVASESKSQEVLFDNPMPSGYPGEGEVVKRYLQDAAEEAAKDDIGLLLAKKPCEVVAYEEEADTPVEEKVDMPSEECEDSKPADDTICKSTRYVLVDCESTLF